MMRLCQHTSPFSNSIVGLDPALDGLHLILTEGQRLRSLVTPGQEEWERVNA